MITTRRLDWVVLVSIVLSGWLASAGSLAQTLTVEGKGTVQILPEFARMSASISHTADTVAAAQAAADRVMIRLLAGVDAPPVAENSIDARQIRIQPRYRWNVRAEMQEFQGYEANRVLAFKLTSLKSLEEALEMLSEQGATTIDVPQFGSAQTRTLASGHSLSTTPGPWQMQRLLPKRPASRWGTRKTLARARNAPLCSEQ